MKSGYAVDRCFLTQGPFSIGRLAEQMASTYTPAIPGYIGDVPQP